MTSRIIIARTIISTTNNPPSAAAQTTSSPATSIWRWLTRVGHALSGTATFIWLITQIIQAIWR